MAGKSLLSLLALVACVSAHATFQQLWINGVDAGNSCARIVRDNNPVTSVSSADIACNAHSSSQGVCSIKPGDKVTVEMHQQAGQRSCGSEAIGGNHFGPVTVYMAAVSDARSASATAASWFKVSQLGLVSNNPDYFGSQVLNDNCGHYTFTVPSITPGNYLIRAEVIALHSASGAGGAQFYPGCFQVNVGGSGSANPPTVKFPGAYSANHPGIQINIYRDLTTYDIPGPTAYGEANPTPATTAWPKAATWNTAQQPSTVPTVVPGGNPTQAPGGGSSSTTGGTPSTPTTSASGPLQTQYGQCGGTGYTGPTVCASPFTCKGVSVPYYYQCQ